MRKSEEQIRMCTSWVAKEVREKELGTYVELLLPSPSRVESKHKRATLYERK